MWRGKKSQASVRCSPAGRGGTVCGGVCVRGDDAPTRERDCRARLPGIAGRRAVVAGGAGTGRGMRARAGKSDPHSGAKERFAQPAADASFAPGARGKRCSRILPNRPPGRAIPSPCPLGRKWRIFCAWNAAPCAPSSAKCALRAKSPWKGCKTRSCRKKALAKLRRYFTKRIPRLCLRGRAFSNII